MNKNNTLCKVNGGGTKYNSLKAKKCFPNIKFKKLFLILTFLLSCIFSYAEVPHSYVTENPKKEVQKIETLKNKEKAELNLSVTKIKSKVLKGRLNTDKKEIEFDLPFSLTGKEIIVIEKLEDLPNSSTVNGRKILTKIMNNKPVSSNIFQKIIENNKLIIKYENFPEKLYVSDLENNYYKVDFSKNEKSDYIPYINEELGMIYNKNYDSLGWGGNRSIDEEIFDSRKNYGNNTFFKKVSGTNKIKVGHTQHRQGNLWVIVYGYDKSGKLVYTSPQLGTLTTYSASPGQWAETDWTTTLPEHCIIVMKVFGNVGDPKGDNSNGDNTMDIGQIFNVKLEDMISTLKGNSILNIAEYYYVNEFIKFSSTTIDKGDPLFLENNLKDVSLQTTGQGFVTMEQGDIFELNGKQSIIGAGGNLGVQTAKIGNLKYSYKIENGKLRLSLNDWGVLEPSHDLTIRVFRTQEGTQNKLVEHTLTIKSPRKVEGTSDIKFDNNYQIRNIVRFQGISLTAPTILTLETPIPQGISLKSQEGQGIPFMKEGDILEINDGMTRAVHSYQIGVNGTLAKQQIKFNSSDITLYVENGKLRIGLNNWLVNKSVKLKMRLIRGTNEIMNHAITFDVPEAPFNIVENGLLDFGQVVAGSKREAETNIVLEMLKDVEEVKFSLSDPQPVMENLKTEDTLKVQEIQYLVRHQGDRRYMVKLHGKLNVPANQQSGEYTGTTILELKIR